MLKKKVTKVGKTYATTWITVPSHKEEKAQQRRAYQNEWRGNKKHHNRITCHGMTAQEFWAGGK